MRMLRCEILIPDSAKRAAPRACGIRYTGLHVGDLPADHSHELECAMHKGRIELLQRMPIFGGIRADTLEFLLALCPIVNVPMNEFFSANTSKAIRCSS